MGHEGIRAQVNSPAVIAFYKDIMQFKFVRINIERADIIWVRGIDVGKEGRGVIYALEFSG